MAKRQVPSGLGTTARRVRPSMTPSQLQAYWLAREALRRLRRASSASAMRQDLR